MKEEALRTQAVAALRELEEINDDEVYDLDKGDACAPPAEYNQDTADELYGAR